MYRQVRAEYIKHRTREYVRAAEAIGRDPRPAHVRAHPAEREPRDPVRMSLLVVGFIKAEVILSFLGLGVPVDQVSWAPCFPRRRRSLCSATGGSSRQATLFMAVFVTAFSLLTDALGDALDRS